MIQGQNNKTVMLVQPQAIVNNGSWTVGELDTMGAEYCDIYVAVGALDIAMVAMKVTETDTSGSGHTDITKTVLGAVGNPALPSATDDNKLYCFRINLAGGRKRFLKPVLTGGNGVAGTFLVCWAVLSRMKQEPITAAGKGLAVEVYA